uniref:Putative group i salivary lipocalin n=1 Tax=Rhipicephalus pulchellus TaxID=72859 RepID=L7LSY0_RHIPC
MWEKHFCLAALFAAVMTTVYSRCTPGCSLNNLDIQNFFNTTEPVWVFNSTAIEKQGCKVDILSQIAAKNIYFKRLYIKHNRTVRQDLTGVIHAHQFDRIYINDGGRNCQQEQLMYMSHDRKCAVVKVVTMWNSYTYYELRVRNSSVSIHLDYDCTQKFHSYHQPEQQIYVRDCQRILQPGCQTSSCYFG